MNIVAQRGPSEGAKATEKERPASRPERVSLEMMFLGIDSGNKITKEIFSGFTICYANKEILHYSYPFYNLDTAVKDMGMGMMIRAIEYAKATGMKYIYLGSLQRPSDTYKLQFGGIQWFDGKQWSDDIESVKIILNGK